MHGIYEWVRSLVCYLVFVTMILNLLPDKKYGTYLRLFAGMVLLLLFFSPLTKTDGLDRRIAGLFERMTFQNEAELLIHEIESVGADRILRLTEQFRSAAEENICRMAEEENLHCIYMDLTLETDPKQEQFGNILAIEVYVTAVGMEQKELRIEANRRIPALKKKIGEYYGLEEQVVSIILEEWEG